METEGGRTQPETAPCTTSPPSCRGGTRVTVHCWSLPSEADERTKHFTLTCVHTHTPTRVHAFKPTVHTRSHLCAHAHTHTHTSQNWEPGGAAPSMLHTAGPAPSSSCKQLAQEDSPPLRDGAQGLHPEKKNRTDRKYNRQRTRNIYQGPHEIHKHRHI